MYRIKYTRCEDGLFRSGYILLGGDIVNVIIDPDKLIAKLNFFISKDKKIIHGNNYKDLQKKVRLYLKQFFINLNNEVRGNYL